MGCAKGPPVMAGNLGAALALVLLVALAAGAVHGANKKNKAKEEAAKAADFLQGRDTDIKPPPKNAGPLEVYLHLLRLKRREQIDTAEKVLSVPDYTKQFKTISMLLDALFPVMQEAMMEIEKAQYAPNKPFPKDRDMQEVLGKVYENVLMFGDFLLRMPGITKKVYNRNKEWTAILRWAVKFCSKSTNVFTGPHAMQLELMKQELGIGPKDPNYVNPFSQRENMMDKTEEDIVKKRVRTRREALEEKMQNMKGPRLRTNRHNEL